MQKYRAEHPEQPILYLDAGRAFPMKTQETDVVIPYTIDAYQVLGLDVMNAGDDDLDAGFNIFAANARTGGFQAVSANLVSIDDSRPVLPPYVIATPRVGTGRATSGPRIAVLGLTKAERYRVISGTGSQKLHFLDPLKVAGDVIPRARSESDLLVVLANLGMSDTRRLVEQHPEIDLVIAADKDQYDPLDMVHNEVPVVMTGIQGKFAIRLDLFQQSGKRRWRAVPDMTRLSANIQVDSEGARFLQRFQSELDERERLRGESKKDGKFPDYVGSEACASCHGEAAAVWAQSAHGRAWKSLQANNSTLNPLCFECHAVGYLKPNGFYLQEQRTELTSVGCEACHGPGGKHVKDPTVRIARANEETCRSCHTSGQSPEFNFGKEWLSIKH